MFAHMLVFPAFFTYRFLSLIILLQGFPGSSIGKESACNAGDPGLIPGLERSRVEGLGYPLQYSWASLVGQAIKNGCNVQDLGLIPGLGRSPAGGHRNPLQYSCLKNPQGQRRLVGCNPRGHKVSHMTERLSTAHSTFFYNMFNALLYSRAWTYCTLSINP